MKSKLLLVFTLTLWLLSPPVSEAGVSRTESFQVSVTIPILVGVNDQQETTRVNGAVLKKDPEILIEKAIRDNQRVLLQTIVAK